MSIKKVVLSNGVRILAERIDQLQSVSIGLWCHTGSAHEHEDEAGITHFIEHMMFKGTQRRTSPEIAQEIEGRGGMLNAFTDKERTCYYCRMLGEDLAVGVDVLCDMVTGSVLDPDELEREKGVVLEEIKRSEDEPGDLVHELHAREVFPNHIYGLPIIGTAESVSSFQQTDLRKYMDRRYHGNTLLMAVAGQVDPDEVVALAEERLGGYQPGSSDRAPASEKPVAGEQYVTKDVEQVHFCIGGPGLSNTDEELPAQWVLDAVLGGGMGSRLFQEVREKRGLAYAIGSYGVGYQAGGAFNVYGGTGKDKWDEMQSVVHAEMKKLREVPVMPDELERVQRQLIGMIVLGLESTSSRMQRMARNELTHGREVTVEEMVEKIRGVTSERIMILANRLFDPSHLRTTAIGPA
ncbi:MAG: insulinase family protein [Fimbriimonadaceae bacterium]|nr:insulinase family protein [Fimbriimonadaceae bacterium]